MKQIWKQRYQIREKLGRGGSGQVYRVWDLHLEKEWAMKELEQGADQELQMLKQLSHPRFPRVVDAFTEADRNFLIMDYLPGITLEELIKKGPIEEKRLLSLAGQVMEALEYLHEHSPVLLYLDLKPSNIILDEHGQIKLVDLGSVMIKGKESLVSGTLGFASPEQIRVKCRGQELNEQSDIFSLGMLLFAMATGKISRLPVVEEGRKYGIFVRQYHPLVSPALEGIIEVCTRGNPGRRYMSTRDVIRDVENLKKRLKGKKGKLPLWKKGYPLFHRDWQQERSLICTQGKKGLYISVKTALGLLITLVWIAVLTLNDDIFPGNYSQAREKKESSSNVVVQGQAEEDKGEIRQELSVIIRDRQGRKVLVREGAAYRTEENLLFEIPWERLDEDSCRITIFCEEEGREPRCFQLNCIKEE
ncbi:MAG: serine/threonine protein kinase [Lachnospiraceae bacterium]|nr:serine/threonine protein kinase [Lachnospiraceae bacterium]